MLYFLENCSLLSNSEKDFFKVTPVLAMLTCARLIFKYSYFYYHVMMCISTPTIIQEKLYAHGTFSCKYYNEHLPFKGSEW